MDAEWASHMENGILDLELVQTVPRPHRKRVLPMQAVVTIERLRG